MNALFQRRFFARNVHNMPTVSTLKSTSTISVAREEKAPDVVKPATSSPDVKKVEEVVVPEVKRVDVTNIASAASAESVVVEKPQQEVARKVPKEVKKVSTQEAKKEKVVQSTAPKVEAKVVPAEGGGTIVEEVKHTHEPLKQTFHVGMILLGCGSSVRLPDGDAK
jgi:U3 small nucleolar RNA-associated protein 14